MAKPRSLGYGFGVYLLFVLSFGSTASALAADKGLGRSAMRLALVIGNADYAQRPLKNPVNDARDMKSVLQELGFEVIYRENADLLDMDSAVRDFTGQLSTDSVGLVYFSGHGAQADNSNYLIPVGASIQDKAELKARAYDAGILLDKMKAVANPLNIVILDACRNNPYKGFRGGEQGLATMSGPKGSFIAYATAPGSVADDNSAGRNGLYTTYLKLYLKQSGLSIEDVFKKVRSEVTRINPEQVPWENSSLTGEFCFAGCPESPLTPIVTPSVVPPDSASIEQRFWDDIKDSHNAASFQAYLKQFPSGLHADLARIEMDILAPKPVIEPPPVAAVEACHDCPEMVEIPGGRFMMGSSSSEEGGQADERPRHEVSVKRFRLGKYEVSKQQFAAFVDATGYSPGNRCWTYENGRVEERSGRSWLNPGYNQATNHPVVCVSAEDADAYAQWLSRKTGKRYRLPTEAEWEYAARAGTDTARFWGDSPDQACQYANVADLTQQQAGFNGTFHQCQDEYVYTAPVGSYRANGLGLYDMLGNVWEWTCSAYAESYDASEKTCTNDASSRRVFRGGSWGGRPAGVRSALRDGSVPSFRFGSLGFRLAQDP